MAPQSTRRKGGRNGRDGFDLKKVLVWRPKQAEAPSQPSQEQHQETEALTKKQLDLCQQRYDDLMRTAEAKLAQMAQENLALKEAQSFADHLAGKNAELQQQLVDAQEQLKEQKKKEEDLVAQIAKLEAQIQSLKAPASGGSSEREASTAEESPKAPSGESSEREASTAEESPKATFGSLKTEAGLKELNDHLASTSYVCSGATATQEDFDFLDQAPGNVGVQFPHVRRWAQHIRNLKIKFPFRKWPSAAKDKGEAKSEKGKAPASGAASLAKADPAAEEAPLQEKLLNAKDSETKAPEETGPGESAAPAKPKSKAKVKVKAKNKKKKNNKEEGEPDAAAIPKINAEGDESEIIHLEAQNLLVDAMKNGMLEDFLDDKVLKADPNDAFRIKVVELMLDKNLDSTVATVIKDLSKADKEKIAQTIEKLEDAVRPVGICQLTPFNLWLHRRDQEDTRSEEPSFGGYEHFWLQGPGDLWLRPHSVTWQGEGPQPGVPWLWWPSEPSVPDTPRSEDVPALEPSEEEDKKKSHEPPEDLAPLEDKRSDGLPEDLAPLEEELSTTLKESASKSELPTDLDSNMKDCSSRKDEKKGSSTWCACNVNAELISNKVSCEHPSGGRDEVRQWSEEKELRVPKDSSSKTDLPADSENPSEDS